jgi:hypothetical protein
MKAFQSKLPTRGADLLSYRFFVTNRRKQVILDSDNARVEALDKK